MSARPLMSSALAAGIDVGLRKGYDVVVLDAGGRLVHSDRGLDAAKLRRCIIDEVRPALVCIDSPSSWSPGTQHRTAELALLAEGIRCFWTPCEERAVRFHDWMRAGFRAYAAVAPQYPRHSGGSLRGTAVECFPHATATLLGGRMAVSERRAMRRSVLRKWGVHAEGLRGPDQVDAALCALTGLLALDRACRVLGGADDGTLVVPAVT